MTYSIRELLPVVSYLARKYTSGESSSVSYETAQSLMNAVIYCIDEYECSLDEQTLPAGEHKDSRAAYELGYELVLSKTHRARELYNTIIIDYKDYGCSNYKDTILSGLPKFFLYYDARFHPQDHLLTLDYPILNTRFDQNGIDLIYLYLQGIAYEKSFMDLFPLSAIKQLLERIQPEYASLYFDNICCPVLLNAIGCIITDQSISTLIIPRENIRQIYDYFHNDDRTAIEQKLRSIIGLIMKRMLNDEAANHYFLAAVCDYAVRIQNGIQNQVLESIFI